MPGNLQLKVNINHCKTLYYNSRGLHFLSYFGAKQIPLFTMCGKTCFFLLHCHFLRYWKLPWNVPCEWALINWQLIWGSWHYGRNQDKNKDSLLTREIILFCWASLISISAASWWVIFIQQGAVVLYEKHLQYKLLYLHVEIKTTVFSWQKGSAQHQ